MSHLEKEKQKLIARIKRSVSYEKVELDVRPCTSGSNVESVTQARSGRLREGPALR
jgi:hypothetical protein